MLLNLYNFFVFLFGVRDDTKGDLFSRRQQQQQQRWKPVRRDMTRVLFCFVGRTRWTLSLQEYVCSSDYRILNGAYSKYYRRKRRIQDGELVPQEYSLLWSVFPPIQQKRYECCQSSQRRDIDAVRLTRKSFRKQMRFSSFF